MKQRYLAIALFLCRTANGFTPPSSRMPMNQNRKGADTHRNEEFLDTALDEETTVVVHEPPLSAEPLNASVHESTPPVNGQEEKKPKEKDLLLEDERTLYEILGASQDATRDELKKQYFKLARETHPDALVGKSTSEKEKEVLFTEVAAAWRILSDKRERRRYDRSLQAKDFTRNVEQVAGEYADRIAKTTAPAVSQVLEMLFRTTAGTTSTESFNAAAKEVREARNNRQKADVRSASAGKARGKKGGRVIDRYELLKKSRELEEISMEEVERSMAIKGELANIMNKRLSLSLRTPNSALTSIEALKLLDGLNTVDSVTFLDSIRQKHPLVHEINCLMEVENDFADKELEATQAQQQLTETKEALWKADLKAQEAVEVEEAARRALEEAKRQVIATRQDLMDWNRMYASAEGQHRRTTQEMEKASLALERKQERVRTALRRKEEEGLELRVTDDRESLGTLGLSDLERLRKEEGYLRAESNRLDDRAKRLRSRARKLKRRCEELKAEEESMSG